MLKSSFYSDSVANTQEYQKGRTKLVVELSLKTSWQIFADFGPGFVVNDVNGENPHSGIVAHITNDKQVCVCRERERERESERER